MPRDGQARRLAPLVACVLVLALDGCRGGDGVEVLRLAHGLDASHPAHLAMERFGDLVAEGSNGRLAVRIYPAEQLGSERECLELLQVGSLALTKVSASVLESFAPAFRALSTPFLFADRDHLRRVLDGDLGARLLAEPAQFRLRGLCFYDAGSRSFYTRARPVRTPDDLVGLKIRTQESASAMEMVRALGGSPTPISWGELYSALDQGIVDGAENNPPSFHLSRHYEIARYYSLDEHTAVPDVLVISTRVWDRLEGGDRRVLARAARESALLQRELWERATAEALLAIRAAGVEIVEPDKDAFAAKVEPLVERYAAEPELGAWIRAIRELAPAEEAPLVPGGRS
ncbi:MAG TPA: TRAP transporter substrate-binding protein [Thermoanaerobaculia bacterium]|nr:TRAP transporter substrate-binding protein [Thermoanaerobaculia bacterium]